MLLIPGNGAAQALDADGETLVARLAAHAASRPDSVAFRFLGDGEHQTDSCTFGDLDGWAGGFARRLRADLSPGDRVLLLLPHDLSFVRAFFGCLYAGVAPVPLGVQQVKRQPAIIQTLMSSASARAIVTSRKIAKDLSDRVGESTAERFICVDETGPGAADPKMRPASGDVAFLQYTSGSTGTPKGVLVSHANLTHNIRAIADAFRVTSTTVAGGWLPMYHDMGLIGLVLAPVYLGLTSVLMPAMAFLQKPVRWLRMISEYGVTVSGAPNFAYDICVDRIDERQRAGLDLRRWLVAFNGSEPVRARTIERFYRAFVPCGLSEDAIFPCYGMAEATLFIAGGPCRREAIARHIDSLQLQNRRIASAKDGPTVSVVSCGRVAFGTRVEIVEPETSLPVSLGAVGEIWVASSCVAGGYVGGDEEAGKAFKSYLSEGGDGPFLRTGDLGFIDAGELCVVGRLKDLVIIRGSNYYPQDLERAAEESNGNLMPGGGAALTVSVDGEERFVLVHELTRAGMRADLSDVARDIQEAMAANYGIRADRVVLVPPGAVPRTTSGKVRRSLCRDLLLRNELNVQYSLVASEAQ